MANHDAHHVRRRGGLQAPAAQQLARLDTLCTRDRVQYCSVLYRSATVKIKNFIKMKLKYRNSEESLLLFFPQCVRARATVRVTSEWAEPAGRR